MVIDDDDSDGEYHGLMETAIEAQEQSKRSRRHRGSIPNHNIIQRGRTKGHQRLFNDYFAKNPVYPPKYFRMSIRISRTLFLRIQNAVESYNPYFIQRNDACRVRGLSSLQKVTAALRMLAYGTSTDFIDDYVRIGENTAIESLRRFVIAVNAMFGERYLRMPNEDDIAKLLAIAKQRGFSEMLGSIDCMHWIWKNCPTAWQGMYRGHHRVPTIILEAVASRNLWIWHAQFGLPRSNNDINMLERSNVFSQLAEGYAPPVNYTINGHDYTMGYYLADGIYPQWSTFVKTIPALQGPKKKYFAVAQESARKDVERAFGVLQARFAIVHGQARFWDKETLGVIMTACVIMHNMIIEDEEDDNNVDFSSIDKEEDDNNDIPYASVSHEHTNDLQAFIEAHHRIRNKATHSQLQSDLVEHLWKLYIDGDG